MKITLTSHSVILPGLALAIFLSCGISAVFGQKIITTDPKNIPVEVVQQSNNPLMITPVAVEEWQADARTFRYAVKNFSDKKVEAFAVSRRSEAGDLMDMVTFISPLAAGDAVESGVNVLKADMGPEFKIVLAVDYVLYADGTSWGKDSRKESLFISAYPEGQKKALAEVKALIDTLNEAALSQLLDRDLTITRLDSLGMDKNKPNVWKSGFACGYQIVLSKLKTIYKTQGINALPSDLKTFNDLVKSIRVNV
jgi:hypothetical protein